MDEAETKFTQKIKEINASIAEVDTALEQLEDAMQQLRSDQNKSDIFVACKVGKHQQYGRVEELEKLPPVFSLELHTDKGVQLMMEGKRMFATITTNYDPLEVEHKEDVSIRLRDDTRKSEIYSVCSLPDGCLVITDLLNKKLKKLDPISYKVSSLIQLPGVPCGICLVDNITLAVALINTKLIQMVSLRIPAQLGQSFPVGDGCRGLTHCDGLLYVCCGGSPTPEHKEGRGHVEVYNLRGDLLQCVYNELSYPVYISVINEGQDTLMHISDVFKGVQVRGTDGVVKHRLNTAIKTHLPFCQIGKHKIIVGEESTRKVYIHSRNDAECEILMTKNDVKGEPTCVYFDDKSSQLVIALKGSDIIKVFKLKM